MSLQDCLFFQDAGAFSFIVASLIQLSISTEALTYLKQLKSMADFCNKINSFLSDASNAIID